VIVRTEHAYEFVVLAETLNFTATAKQLMLAQPALSKHIQMLEHELGVQLLERSTHSVVLTEDGRLALESFRRIVDEYTALKRECEARQAGLSGFIRVGALYYGLDEQLGPIIRESQQRYPLLRIEVESMQPRQVVRGLKDGSLDVGLIMRTPALPGDEFTFVHLQNEPLFAIRTDDGRPRPRVWELRELADETLVIMSADAEYMDAIMSLVATVGVKPARVVDAIQVDLVPTKLRDTGGVFLGPRTLEHMASDLVLTRVRAGRPLYLEMGFAALRSRPTPATDVFLALCQEHAARRVRRRPSEAARNRTLR